MDWKHETEALTILTKCDKILWEDSDDENYQWSYKNIHINYKAIYGSNEKYVYRLKIRTPNTPTNIFYDIDEVLGQELYNAIIEQKNRLDLPYFWQQLGIKYDALSQIKFELGVKD